MSEHEQFQRHLVALAAGTLPEADEAALRAHLAVCPECARQEQVWTRLAQAVGRLPQTTPTPARLSRLAALAEARRQAVLERRWNRLVLTGLVLYGWALFVVGWPVLRLTHDWLAVWLDLPGLVLVVLGLTFWFSFCWVIGLALLPLLRAEKTDLEEKVT